MAFRAVCCEIQTIPKFERVGLLTHLEIELASLTALEILNHSLQIEVFDVGCNESRPDLTLYHVAASRGMWQLIAHLLSSKKVTGIDANCANKHGITPMYLAKFMGENVTDTVHGVKLLT